MTIQAQILGTRRVPDLTGLGMGRVFFPHVGNPMSTRCFATTMILYCEHAQMCSFCYIDYDLC
jgi:hypothetical protein